MQIVQDHSQWPVKKFKFDSGMLPEGGVYVDKVLGPLKPDTLHIIKAAIFIEECEDR